MAPARRLFVSDVHGQTETLQRLLTEVAFQLGTDQLVLLGDYVAPNSQSVQCLLAVRDLCAYQGARALMGNHDLALSRYLKEGTAGNLEGVYAYIPRLAAEIRREQPDLAEFLAGLPLWYEDERFIAVHAGFDPGLGDWRLSTTADFTEIRAPFLETKPDDPRTVVFGHTPCQVLHGSPNVWFGPGKIGIDGGAAHGQQLNCLVFDGQRVAVHSVSVANPHRWTR